MASWSPWLLQMIKRAFPTRYLAARATRLPVLGKVIDRWLFDGDVLIYLPLDRVVEVNESIELPGEVVLPSQVVERFIDRANRFWIMNRCICRDGGGCQDYPIDLGCLFLGEAAQGIAPELGRQATRAEAREHVRRCREAGLVHMIGRMRLDALLMGIGPGDRLLTICNCCPCCCLMGALPYLSPTISAKITRMPGVVVGVNDRCVGCGTCGQGVCFVDAIRLVDGRTVISEACRGCGRCVAVCPEGAIELSIEGEWSVGSSLERIAAVVDVA